MPPRACGGASTAWRILALLFIFLAIDDLVTLHEHLTVRVRGRLQTSGYLYFAWVIPYRIAKLAVTVLYARFLQGLPTRTRALFLVSGAIYVTGAIGFEMLGGKYIGMPTARESIFSVLYTLEETLEMLGIALVVYALLNYMRDRIGMVRCTVKRDV